MGLDNLDQNYYDRKFPGTNHPWNTPSGNQVAKYRKKPIVVEAEQFVIWDLKNIPPFVTVQGVTFPVTKEATIVVPTLEGQHIASNLDWIIRGVNGELYPCKPDIFEKTYEEIWD